MRPLKVSLEGSKKTNGFRYQGLIVLKPPFVAAIIVEVIQIDVKIAAPPTVERETRHKRYYSHQATYKWPLGRGLDICGLA